MDLQQLRYIIAVNRERHFQKAARRAGISQPTLSLQIQKLEKELGVLLFERSPHRVSLTAAGEKFIPQAQALLESLDKAVVDLKERSNEVAGRIRLAAIPTVGPYLLPGVIQSFSRLAPKVTLEMHDLTTSLLLEYLKDGRVDLGILALPIETSGMLFRSLGNESFLLAVARRHPLAKKKQITTKEILAERMLILQEGHCFRNQTLSYCKISAQDPQIVFQGSSLTSVMRLTAAGNGVTLVPRMAAEPRQNPDLVFIPFAKPGPSRELGIVWRITTPLTRAHHLLIDSIETAFQNQLQ